jgi:hypothetical protein
MQLNRIVSRLSAFLLAVAVCYLPGCLSLIGAEPAAASTDPDKREATAPREASGATNMDEINTQAVKITAAESKSHELPAAEIVLDLGETGMSGRKFREKGEYLTLSGPPGGPLGLTVSHIAKLPKSADDWHSLAKKLNTQESTEMGHVGTLKIAGAERAAFTYTTDDGSDRSHHLMIVFAVPDSKDGILVDFYRGTGTDKTPAPEVLAADDIFAEISPSLSIRFE